MQRQPATLFLGIEPAKIHRLQNIECITKSPKTNHPRETVNTDLIFQKDLKNHRQSHTKSIGSQPVKNPTHIMKNGSSHQ